MVYNLAEIGKDLSKFSKVIDIPIQDDGFVSDLKTDLCTNSTLFIQAPWQSWSDWVPERQRTIGGQSAKQFFKPLIPGIEPSYNCSLKACGCGRSYNFITFSDYFVGIVPDFNSIAIIECRSDSEGNLIVSLRMYAGGSAKKNNTAKIIVTRGFSLLESLEIYKNHIAKPSLKIMKNRRIGFSWPFYGISVTQKKIEKEIESGGFAINGQSIVDSYILDHGYQIGALNGDWVFDKTRFPDVGEMIKVFNKNKIVPGIWIAPFLASKDSMLFRKHPEYFLYDKNGKIIEDSRWLTPNKNSVFPKKNFVLDISKNEVRDYLFNIFKSFYNQGFRIFKVDYLHAIFGYELGNKQDSPVTYYRNFFLKLRENLGPGVEFVGCGAPLMESIGLFEGMRFTNDSALGKLAGFDKLDFLSSILNQTTIPRMINDYMYKNAMTVAMLNFPTWKDLHGLILDGVHLADNHIPISRTVRLKMNQLYFEYKRMGGNNIFIGDSLVEINNNLESRKAWTAFLAGEPDGEP